MSRSRQGFSWRCSVPRNNRPIGIVFLAFPLAIASWRLTGSTTEAVASGPDLAGLVASLHQPGLETTRDFSHGESKYRLRIHSSVISGLIREAYAPADL